MKFNSIVLALCVSGCSSVSSSSSEPSTSAVVKATELSAQDLMEVGLSAIKAKEWDKAISYFKMALDTGELNDLGTAGAYWNIGFASLSAGYHNIAGDSFYFFMETCVNTIESYPGNKEDVFWCTEKISDMGSKMAFADAVYNLIWYSGKIYYGRTPKRPVIFRELDAPAILASFMLKGQGVTDVSVVTTDKESAIIVYKDDGKNETIFFTVLQ